MENKMTPSVRKFIRKQKALIRRQILDKVKQKEALKELYNRVNPKNDDNK